ncbi:STAS-like domain-containing protein [Rheinheimera aquimaris]|uniref:STAS-like domain-containing protein n=1 Tax=Rheinheimera aquimaris TaxID=412437 RepID=UPI003A97AFA6
MININIATQFSKTPFGRYQTDSPYSAEKFRDEILLPIFQQHPNETIVIDFTGVSLGLGSSFLEEAFGGLVRKGLNPKLIDKQLQVISKLPIYEQQIRKFIKSAETS